MTLICSHRYEVSRYFVATRAPPAIGSSPVSGKIMPTLFTWVCSSIVSRAGRALWTDSASKEIFSWCLEVLEIEESQACDASFIHESSSKEGLSEKDCASVDCIGRDCARRRIDSADASRMVRSEVILTSKLSRRISSLCTSRISDNTVGQSSSIRCKSLRRKKRRSIPISFSEAQYAGLKRDLSLRPTIRAEAGMSIASACAFSSSTIWRMRSRSSSRALMRISKSISVSMPTFSGRALARRKNHGTGLCSVQCVVDIAMLRIPPVCMPMRWISWTKLYFSVPVSIKRRPKRLT